MTNAQLEAIDSITESGKRLTQKNIIYRWICEAGFNGMTNAEIVERAERAHHRWAPGTVSGRLKDLQDGRLIESQIVWSATKQAMVEKARLNKHSGQPNTIWYSKTGEYQATLVY